MAADLLGQAEHGPTSPAVLVTTSLPFGRSVLAEVDAAAREPGRPRDVAGQAWRDTGEVVLVRDRAEAVAVADEYAPEHLEVQVADGELDGYAAAPDATTARSSSASEATVAYGDKAVGTNHVLPTGRAARYTGGLWVGKFLKTVTFQRLTAEGTRRVAPAVAAISHAEGLAGHASDRRAAAGARVTASLDGQVAVVTGAGGGLGSACAEALALAGASLIARRPLPSGRSSASPSSRAAGSSSATSPRARGCAR